MRLSSLITFALFALTHAVLKEQQQVLITYPDGTPQSEIDTAMDTLRKAGGIVLHEFSLIKGFAAKASTEAVESIKTLSETWLPLVEEDSIVSIDGGVNSK